MIRLHDEEDGGGEPVRGLPVELPEDERLLWQGSPGVVAFLVHVFHIRFVIGYFVMVAVWRLARSVSGAAPVAAADILLSALAGLAMASALLVLLAWMMARSTVYSITSRRVVLRYGVAIRKYVNLPFARIEAAGLREYGRGRGDIELRLAAGSGGPGYLRLWPHARPLRFGQPRPLLRGLSDARGVSGLLARAVGAQAPDRISVSRMADRPESTHAGQPASPAALAGGM